jgi:hypothetical protein
MIFDDEFYQIGQGEIFQKSSCLLHEHAMANFFQSLLISLGYQTEDSSGRIWNCGTKQVIVCLADDFVVCGADLANLPEHWYSPNTTVITDNVINFVSEYKVMSLPISYFGIYAYTPDNLNFQPTYRFNFSVNRMDTQRQLVLFELVQQSQSLDQLIKQDLINFNCWEANSNHWSSIEVQQNFTRCWNLIPLVHEKYQQEFDQLLSCMPLRNHTVSVEQAQILCFLNIVIETYAGNYTVALSEKIFRALCTPSPWILWAAKNTVAHLKTIGFDVLDDIIDHTYDLQEQNVWPPEAKAKNFVESGIQNYQKLTQLNRQDLLKRCQQAANHNQQHLYQWQRQWPLDLTNWLPELMDQIK